MATWKHIPVEDLVPAATLSRAMDFNLEQYVYDSNARGINLRWLAPSKRLLWMAAGIEHIEPELLDWIDKVPKSSAYYDLGASNGIFALYAAKRGLNVIAIEPDPSNYFLLSWNAFLNRGPDTNIGAFNIAASDEFSVGELFIRKMELGAHEKIVSAPLTVAGESFVPDHIHQIQMVHFDKWIELMHLPEPEYIKIDVDGHEIPVIRGASQSLRRCKQVFIEIEAAKHKELDDMLRELGLEMTEKYQVQNYSDLWNCIYSRS